MGRVVARMPALVDDVVVVDDASTDGTAAAASAAATAAARRGVVVVRQERNLGVGAAIVAGYRQALRAGADLVAVMAGDAQMDPTDLRALLVPVARGDADYAKGNRFAHPACFRVMPLWRWIGNRCLTLLTRVVSGLWTLRDSQCGYAVVHRRTLEALDLDRLWPRYGFPNDLLVHLGEHGFRVVDVPVRPVYDGERSGIRPLAAVFSHSYVLGRALLWRVQCGLRRIGLARTRARALPSRSE